MFQHIQSPVLAGFLSVLAFFGTAQTAKAQDNVEANDLDAIIEQLHALSPHADATSLSFTRWNADGQVPATCAGCHTTSGFLDRMGADGTARGTVEHPVPIGETVTCAACHAPTAEQMLPVAFPSGAVHDHGLASASCLSCHQGRSSADTVATATAAIESDDTVSPDLRFINIHYAPAAVLLGSEARGGFEYPERDYAGRFAHVEGFTTCTDCHNPHSLEVSAAPCAACHGDVALDAIRLGSPDMDGDGDTAEGVSAEIHALHTALGKAIDDYADAHGGAIAYAKGFPYFFNDSNGNGTVDEAERKRENAYTGFTPRLLRAAYNYQVVATDPGAWAHNPRYAGQLLYDSIADLASTGATPALPGDRP